MEHTEAPQAILTLFAAMNRHDAEAAAAVVDPNIEILVGPHVMTGVDVIREFALQDDPALTVVNTVSSSEERAGQFEVGVHRVTHWRESGELSSEEDLTMSFRVTSDGLICWAHIA